MMLDEILYSNIECGKIQNSHLRSFIQEDVFIHSTIQNEGPRIHRLLRFWVPTMKRKHEKKLDPGLRKEKKGDMSLA